MTIELPDILQFSGWLSCSVQGSIVEANTLLHKMPIRIEKPKLHMQSQTCHRSPCHSASAVWRLLDCKKLFGLI